MKKVFLDCGAHLGQGLKHLIKLKAMDPSWEIHSWEANPYTYAHLIENYSQNFTNVKFHNAAISTFDGFIDMNIETTKQKKSDVVTDFGQGSSIVGLEDWDSGLHKGTFTKKEKIVSIDFSNWIRNNFQPKDYVIIKFDIEGAEYDVLEKIIQDGTLEYIDEIYIEWHSRFFNNKEKILSRESAIKEKIKHLEQNYIGPK